MPHSAAPIKSIVDTGVRFWAPSRRVVLLAALANAGALVLQARPRWANLPPRRSPCAGVLVRPGGQLIVVAAELAAIGVGIAGVVKGVRRSFAEEIDLSSTSPTACATITRLGQVSYLAQGLVLSLVGTQSAPCSTAQLMAVLPRGITGRG